MSKLQNLRHFNQAEKQAAIKILVEFINANFVLVEGETAESVASDAVEEVSQELTINLFNQGAMVDSLVSCSKKVIGAWTSQPTYSL